MTRSRLLAVLLLFLFTTSFAAGAAVRETNANRMAKGLPPLPPRWVPTRTRILAASPSPSPSPSSSHHDAVCQSGNAPLCCSSAVPATDTSAAFLLKLLGVTTPRSDLGLVAITCTPLGHHVWSVSPAYAQCWIGYLPDFCSARQVVCCAHDEFNGVVATGCTLRRS
ncbi:hypothetical protein C8R47DRAFT_1104695 [Mycena vitilis]|nr:hypothetical protein C8R47DRAFT_1104695 [Mycena vitilis]